MGSAQSSSTTGDHRLPTKIYRRGISSIRGEPPCCFNSVLNTFFFFKQLTAPLVIAFVLNDQMLEGSRREFCPLMKWYERNLCGKYCRITIPSLYPLLFCYSIHESILERTNLILQIQRTFDISFSVSPNSINCLCTCVIAQNA